MSIVLHMSNGMDVTYASDEEVEVVTDPDPALTAVLNDMEANKS